VALEERGIDGAFVEDFVTRWKAAWNSDQRVRFSSS
jgi:hypothetical protein